MYNNFSPLPPFNQRYKTNHSSMKQSNFQEQKMKHFEAKKNCLKNETKQDHPKMSQAQHPEHEFIFEIFGLKIYFDDLLLICIIFFLYQEGIQDQYLFIALILLLLS